MRWSVFKTVVARRKEANGSANREHRGNDVIGHRGALCLFWNVTTNGAPRNQQPQIVKDGECCVRSTEYGMRMRMWRCLDQTRVQNNPSFECRRVSVMNIGTVRSVYKVAKISFS